METSFFSEGDLVFDRTNSKIGVVTEDEKSNHEDVSVFWADRHDHEATRRVPSTNLHFIAPASRDLFALLGRLQDRVGQLAARPTPAQASDEALAALKDNLERKDITVTHYGRPMNPRVSPRVKAILKNVLNHATLKNFMSDNPLDAQRNAAKWELLEAALMILDQQRLLNRPKIALPTETFTMIDAWFEKTPPDEPIRMVRLGGSWYNEDNEYMNDSHIDDFVVVAPGRSNG